MVDPPVVNVVDLVVRYGQRVALDSVSLRIGDGVVGLLGPNGAGKTSLLSVLATVGKAHKGRAIVRGHDVASAAGRAAARRLIGWLPQRFDLSGSMTLRDTVAYAAWSHGVPTKECALAASKALAVVGLAERSSDRVRRLSGGQRQRVGLAAAIAHGPSLLLLDEPTVGLDPSQRVRFRRYLKAISTGRTIVLATHLIDDVAHLCEELIVLRGGTVAYQGPTQALAADHDVDDDGSGMSTPLERAYERLVGHEGGE